MFSKSTTVLAVSASLVLSAFNAAQADVYDISIDIMENATSWGSGPGYQLGDMWNISFTLTDESVVTSFAVQSEVIGGFSMEDIAWEFGELGLSSAYNVFSPHGDPDSLDYEGLFGFSFMTSMSVGAFMTVGTYGYTGQDFSFFNEDGIGGLEGFSDSAHYNDGDDAYTYATIQVTAVPAPGALALLGLAAGMARRRRRG